jgi:hypothetical protein
MQSSFVARIAVTTRTTALATFVGLAALSGTAGAGLLLAGPAVAAPVPAVEPSNTGMYGDPAKASRYWAPQSYDDCVLMSVADVVGQVTGKLPSEQEIIQVAERTPSQSHPGSIYVRPANPDDEDAGMGTDGGDIEVLLAHYGIHVDSSRDGVRGSDALDSLKTALAQRHAVMVGVYADTIWSGTEPDGEGGDHMLVVTGIDAKNGVVHLNDSGTEDGRDEQVPLARFMKAWKGADFAMVVTREAVK